MYINKILEIHKFEPNKKHLEELVGTDESDATSVDEDTDDKEDEEVGIVEEDEHHNESVNFHTLTFNFFFITKNPNRLNNSN